LFRNFETWDARIGWNNFFLQRDDGTCSRNKSWQLMKFLLIHYNDDKSKIRIVRFLFYSYDRLKPVIVKTSYIYYYIPTRICYTYKVPLVFFRVNLLRCITKSHLRGNNNTSVELIGFLSWLAQSCEYSIIII